MNEFLVCSFQICGHKQKIAEEPKNLDQGEYAFTSNLEFVFVTYNFRKNLFNINLILVLSLHIHTLKYLWTAGSWLLNFITERQHQHNIE